MHRTRISYGSHHSQVGDLWLPGTTTGELPLVVLIHGGFWRAQFTKGLMSRLARAVVERGWAAWNIEYRRVGPMGGGGGWPQTFEDVAEAVDHVASFSGIDNERIATCGHSAGGTLGLWVAGRHRPVDGAPGSSTKVTVAAAVSLAGVLDLATAHATGVGADAVARLLGGSEVEIAERVLVSSPFAMVPLGVPQILIHGSEDTVVPFTMSEHYAEQARKAGDDVRLIPLPGVGHRDLIDPRGQAWVQTATELERVFAR
jgi:acetyl esterase/lipase